MNEQDAKDAVSDMNGKEMLGFCAELFLPVLFMCLLIIFKLITTASDSPNVAFYCGNVYPWFYGTHMDWNEPFTEQIPFKCNVKPDTCETENYYQDHTKFYYSNMPPNDNFQGYGQYGYTHSSLSDWHGTNPYYTFTIGDQAAVYNDQLYHGGPDNPSISLCRIIGYLTNATASAILAIAPRDNAGGAEIYHAGNLEVNIDNYCGYPETTVLFDSASAVDSYINSEDYDDVGYGNGKVAFSIIINEANNDTAKWDYTIRTNYTDMFSSDEPSVACLYGSPDWCWFYYTIPSTKIHTEDLYKPQGTLNLYGYTFTGFSTMQMSVDNYIMSYTNYVTNRKQQVSSGRELEEGGDDVSNLLKNSHVKPGATPSVTGAGVWLMPSVSLMPTAPFKTDDFQYIIGSTLGIFYMLSFLYPVSRIVRALVLEKETRIKEGMKMMGLSDTVYNLSWLITTFIQMTLVSALITLVTSSSVFEYSDKFYVFIYFEVFSLAIINMCFLMATFFSKSKAASLLGPMIFFGSFFPYYAVNDPTMDTASKTATCVLAPACFALGANVFADYEGGLVGVQSGNTNTTTSNFTYNACVGMMFFDAVLYGVLAWYLDKVFPSEYGTQLPLYFPFLPSYWCGVKLTKDKHTIKNISDESWWTRLLMALRVVPSRKYSRVSQDGQDAENDSNVIQARMSLEAGLLEDEVEGTYVQNSHSQYFEPVSAELRQQLNDEKCVSIRNLRKVFKNPAGGDDRVAVAGLNLDLYQGQVTVLLGHNGAGKTTTISMLVGLIPPSGGDAVLPGGLRITDDMQAIRRNLGVCPQHDILFPELTVMQHLQIYASFKGVQSNQVNSEARRMLSEVGLTEKAHARSSTLSGGQKRKLSLGMALIGDSKVVILDEPTSGMDPYSRRSTWNIIQRNKKGRVILLTTHFMDEADLLGDRVAIMAHGKLQCVGNPMFLKSRFGVGYTLTIVKSAQTNQNTHQLSVISNAITNLVTTHIPVGELLSDVGAEQSFRLPFTAADKFVTLFEEIDKQKEKLKIAEYGISVTTLEEVFIRVGEMENEEAKSILEERKSMRLSLQNCSAPEVSPAGVVDGEGDAFLGNSTAVVGSVQEFGIGDNVSRAVDMGTQTRPSLIDKSESRKSEDHQKHRQQPDVDGFMFFKHFNALFIKRFIYGKRDQRMLCCQLILPVMLLIVGLSILLIQPDFTQPDLILVSSHQNTDLSVQYRNFVPFNLEQPPSEVATQLMSRFNGNADDGVAGVAVPIYNPNVVYNDSFATCSQGAIPLHTTSNFLLQSPSVTQKHTEIDEHGSSRYGSVTVANTTNANALHYNMMINGSSVHGVGIYMNEVHNAFLQVVSGIPTAKIVTHNYPLQQTVKQEQQQAATSAFIVSLFAMIAFCFIPASFAVFVVKEREVKAKHQQIISGVSIYAYWCSTYLFDILSYIPTALLVIAMLHAYDIPAYCRGEAGVATIILFLLNGPATAAMTYLISYIFKSHSTAQIVVMFFNFLTGLCLMVVSFVLTLIPSTSSLALSLRYLFRLFPSFCLGDGLSQLAQCIGGDTCPSITSDGYDPEHTQGPLSWDIAGGNIAFLVGQSVIYFLLVLCIEYSLTFPSLLSWLYKVEDSGYVEDVNEDEDVRKERLRVARGGANGDVVRIDSLRKVYPIKTAPKTKVAVQCLSFGIPKGECFGFLGINGAGKTTTLSILSGDFPQTSGNAFIDGFNIQEDQTNIRRRIGYCPQFDALLELLTCREHLQLYGRIKGLTGDALEEVVVRKLTQLDLLDFEHKTAGSLSGGNKRKLSVAVATIGDPSILFLDEPSTGMDPVARRFMWEVIAKMSTQGGKCSVILTTHSMEEAEALCTRIGVMVNGRLTCLGSGQHLKHRFGNGFEVNIRTLTPSPESVMEIAKRLLESPLATGGRNRSDSRGRRLSDANNPIAEFMARNVVTVGLEGGVDIHQLELIPVRQVDLPAICAALNNPFRVNNIAPYKSGALLHEMFTGNDSVSVKLFLEWWLAEDVADTLEKFMSAEFPDRATLLERSTSQNFRYRVKLANIESNVSTSQKSAESVETSHDHTLSALSEVFAKFEQHKASLCVQEYSVGQTTLEQIFNQFAAQQDNPEVAAILVADASNRSTSRSGRGGDNVM